MAFIKKTNKISSFSSIILETNLIEITKGNTNIIEVWHLDVYFKLEKLIEQK